MIASLYDHNSKILLTLQTGPDLEILNKCHPLELSTYEK